MEIKITKNVNALNQKSEIVVVNRGELNSNQERAYRFAEKMLKSGTDLLKVEAQSRLAANGLSFSPIYGALND